MKTNDHVTASAGQQANRNGTHGTWRRAWWAALALTVPLATAACGANPAPQASPKHHTGPTTKADSKNSSAVKPLSLTTLPPLTYEKQLNPWLKYTHEVSSFIPQMGYHWTAPVPGLVLMTNNSNQVVAVEATFPQKLGTYPWYDPPTTEPNAGVAFNSEHLYFVPPTAITPTMAATLPTNLASWSAFETANPRLTSTYLKQTTTFHGDAVYAPKSGPAIKVLVAPSGKIGGFMVAEPAGWGWQPEYQQAKGKPVKSALFGKAYDSVLWLLPAADGSSNVTSSIKNTSKSMVHKTKTGTKMAVNKAKHASKTAMHKTKSDANKMANQAKHTANRTK